MNNFGEEISDTPSENKLLKKQSDTFHSQTDEEKLTKPNNVSESEALWLQSDLYQIMTPWLIRTIGLGFFLFIGITSICTLIAFIDLIFSTSFIVQFSIENTFAIGPIGMMITILVYAFVESIGRFLIYRLNITLKDFYKSVNYLETISEIQEKISTIYRGSRQLYGSIWLLRIILGKAYKNALTEYMNSQIYLLLTYLRNLQNDLDIRISEQTKNLYDARSSIKKLDILISGSKNLSLSNTRLDRQIEQFEELQRALIKI